MYSLCLLVYWVQFSVRNDKMLLIVEFLKMDTLKTRPYFLMGTNEITLNAHTVKPYTILQVKKVMQSLCTV
jgi:hypothetical protein